MSSKRLPHGAVVAAVPHTFPVRRDLATNVLANLAGRPNCADEYFDALSAACHAAAGARIRDSYKIIPLAAGVKYTVADLLRGTSRGWVVRKCLDGAFEIETHDKVVAWTPEEAKGNVAIERALTTVWVENRAKIDLFDWEVGVAQGGYTVTHADNDCVEFTLADESGWAWTFEPDTLEPLGDASSGPPLDMFVRPPCPVPGAH